ncbi:MAG: AAA family ATPase [Methylococcaceae bacterium]
MKILSLYFKNINSLQGENRVDFNQAPLVDAGVFAITGPNGSGKSSILDAITLALYGETFKFDRPAEHVMTRHSSECFAQCEFMVHNIAYRSHWHVQREQDTADSALLPATMQLTRLSDGETLLASDCANVRKQVAEIVGMDFRNFTRSTLLAQGDFAAFLNALDSERLDILEKIVSTDMYADYKQDIILQVAQEQEKLTLLHADLDVIPLLDAVAVEAREQDLIDFKEQVGEFTTALDDLTQNMARLQALAVMDEEYSQEQLKHTALQQRLQQINTDLQRIEASQGVAALQADAATAASQQAAVDAENATLEGYRQQLTQLQAQVDLLGLDSLSAMAMANKSVPEQQELIADLTFQAEHLHAENSAEKALINTLETQLNEKQAEVATVKAWLEAHTQDVSLLDGFPEIGPLKKLTAQINELKSQQKSSLKASKESTAQLKSNQSGLQTLLKETPELQKKALTYEDELKQLLNGYTLEELEGLRTEQQERVADFKELIALTKVQSRFKDGLLVRLGLFSRPDEIDVAEVNQQVDVLTERLLTEDNIKKALEQAVVNESLLKKMQADRVHLVDNEPCPLCGSLKHPYAIQPPKILDSKQALVDQTARVQTITTSVAKLRQQLVAAQKQLDNKQLKADRLTRIQSEWTTLCNRLNIASHDLHIDQLNPIKKLLTQHATELKDIERLIKDVRRYQKKIATLNATIDIQSTSLTRLQEIMLDVNPVGIPLLADLTALDQTYAQYVAEEKLLSEKVMTQLSQLGEKMPGKGKEDALFDRLNLRRQAYQTYLLRDKLLHEDIEQVQQKIQLAQEDLTVQTKRLQDCTAKLRIEQGSGLQLAVIEKQKLIHEKELSSVQLKAQQQTLQQALQAQASQFGVQNYAELTALLQLLPQQAMLLQQRDELAAQEHEMALALQSYQARQQLERTLLIADKLLDDCELEHKVLLEKKDIAHAEVLRLEELLTKQAKRQEKYNAVLDRIAEQQAHVAQATLELQQVNTENGHVFRRKVQRKTADKLLARTNQILEKISGRFYVRQGDNEQGLALEVEDTFQHNTRRLPKTLSGGESFVVSLALALGLSELASNGQSIESLFLDEGFGNLDAEALYTVISTLENLQTQGKKVGVISHVEGVRKRIKTQIEMIKKPNGFSELRAVI